MTISYRLPNWEAVFMWIQAFYAKTPSCIAVYMVIISVLVLHFQ